MRIERDSQQPPNTAALIALLTLKNCSTAAGVTIIVLEGKVAPSIVTAKEIAPTVPPVGIAIFAPKLAYRHNKDVDIDIEEKKNKS